MADIQPRMNPLIAVAAASIIVFSAVGIGVMTGVIPSSFSKNAESVPATGAAVQTGKSAEATKPAEAKKSAAADAPRKPVTREASRPAPAPAAQPAQPAQVASNPPAAPAVCLDCGRVEAINVVEEKGEGTGLGAVAGGVVGGILGNQVGRGSGRKIATVAGAAGGAYAGHEIEKHAKSTKRYEIRVRMENGTTRSVSYDAEPSFRVGDKVKIVNGMLVSS